MHWRSPLAQYRQVVRGAIKYAEDWCRMDPAQRANLLAALRVLLRRDGLKTPTLERALGVVSACATDILGLTARPTQIMAAAALLDNRMAEMATGEGKTLAIAMAAAVAALAGIPVHVITANDYLANRDAKQLAAFFQQLGLRATALASAVDDMAKRSVYRHDVVYATAKELAFDFLRDRQNMSGTHELVQISHDMVGQKVPAPLMRGLCMALLDEADSILLDEAELPLILSRSVSQASRRAFLWQALALARQLKMNQDFTLQHGDRRCTLTNSGEARLAVLTAGLGALWQRPRYRREAVAVALAALHVYRRNEHYLVRAGAIDLLDEVTGRAAPGRVWSRGLHTVVALKEGVSPPAETETVAQITFQRFFQRYWRLSGISGTLREASHELHAVYGTGVVRVPLHLPSQRRELPPRRFIDRESMFSAVVERILQMQAVARPVLVGTDSVADSQYLSQRLQAHGIEHQVLNALTDTEEASIIARAGQSGQVTVATRMAGRGTDIQLDDTARKAGGLHVLSCQNNPSCRLDRQLAGRAGRQGDPGSTEIWSFKSEYGTNAVPLALRRWVQWRDERQRMQRRLSLLRQDIQWEQRLSFAGYPI
jgi:preprotein translocase subunit SecA